MPGGFVHNRHSSLVKAGVSMLRQAVFIGLLFPPSVATRHLPRKRGKEFCARRLRTQQAFVACQSGCVDASSSGVYWAFIPPFRRYATPSPASGERDFVPGGHRCLHLSKVVKMAVKTKETSCFFTGEPRLGFVVQVASCALRGKYTRGERVSAERTMESWTSRYFCLPPSLRGISRYPLKMLAFFMGTRSPAGGRRDFSSLITGLCVYQKVRTHLI